MTEASHHHVFRVQRTKGWFSVNFRELWEYRELLWFFVWRDVKVRYKQTFLGASWALLQPLAGMIVFSIIFGSWIGVPSQHVPYPLFVVSGLLLWTYFSTSLTLTMHERRQQLPARLEDLLPATDHPSRSPRCSCR